MYKVQITELKATDVLTHKSPLMVSSLNLEIYNMRKKHG